MFGTWDIVIGFVTPGVVCAAILILAWRPWRRGALAVDARWANGIAIGVAYAIGYGRLVGDLGIPPANADTWILYLMPVVMAIGILFCVIRRAPLIRLACVVAICGALNYLLVRPLAGQPMTGGAAAAWTFGGTLLMTVWWVIFNTIALRAPRMLGPITGVLVSSGAAAILADRGLALRGGFPLAVLALELAASGAVSAWGQRFRLAGGGTLAVTLVIVGIAIYAYHYIYPEPGVRLICGLAIVLAAPCAALVIWLPWMKNRADWQKTVIAVVAVVLVVAAAVIVAGVGRAPAGGGSEVAVSW